MSYKKKMALVFMISTFVSVGSLLAAADKFSLFCSSSNYISGCVRSLEIIVESLFLSGGALALTFLCFLFLPEAIFHTWKKFAIVYIPLAAIWVGITGAGSSGSGLGADAEGILFFTSGLYGVITVLIILTKGTLIFLHNRRK